MTKETSKKRQMEGTVVSKSGAKTVKVEVTRKVQHPIYRKQFTKTKRYLAHDHTDAVQVGETVTIEESRPLSRLKRWVVIVK